MHEFNYLYERTINDFTSRCWDDLSKIGNIRLCTNLYQLVQDLATGSVLKSLTFIRMNTMTPIARFFFAIAIAALGIQHFIYLHFLPDLEPVPVWLRDRAIPACILGVFLVAIAFGMAIGKMGRQAATLLGVICLLNSVGVHLPRLIADLQRK
jgi:hypothetical protein